MANLTGSWLAFRLGVDPARIESMRKAGELYAVRDESRGEWHYPSWQFDSAGQTKPAVAEFLASARREKIAPAELTDLLDRRVGLAGGKRVLDLFLNGGDKNVFRDARRATLLGGACSSAIASASSRTPRPSSSSSRVIVSGGATITTFQCTKR